MPEHINSNNKIPIVNPAFFLDNFKDSNYKNIAYALAELFDNSIQAEATNISLLLPTYGTQEYFNELAVADNGYGMNFNKLHKALSLGESSWDEPGMGKYGRGLLASSLSSGKRVEVYSWDKDWSSKNGDPTKKCLMVYMDKTELMNKDYNPNDDNLFLKPPTEVEIPNKWVKSIKHKNPDFFNNQSGTIVVWSELQQQAWRTKTGLFRHVSMEAGRMYRYYLWGPKKVEGLKTIDTHERVPRKVNINLIDFKESLPSDTSINIVKHRDPLFLMPNSDFSPDSGEFENLKKEKFNFEIEPMFQEYGASGNFQTTNDDHISDPKTGPIEGKVSINCSIVKRKARDFVGGRAGSLDHGKAAKRLQNFSVLRERREMDWARGLMVPTGAGLEVYRWIGCEIDFDKSLDPIMGTTDEKQSAKLFVQALEHVYEMESEAERQNYKNELYEDMKNKSGDEDQDSLAFCTFWRYVIAIAVSNAISALQKEIANRPALMLKTKDDGEDGSTDVDAEVIGTDAAKGDKKEGLTDVSEPLSDKEKIKEIVDSYSDDDNYHSTQEEKENYAKALVKNQSKFAFISSQLSGSKMFEINPKGNMLHIIFNRDHPLFKLINEFATDEIDNEGNLKTYSNEELVTKLERSKMGLRFLFMSWARMEDVMKNSNSGEYDNAVGIRDIWGSYSKNFLQKEFQEDI